MHCRQRIVITKLKQLPSYSCFIILLKKCHYHYEPIQNDRIFLFISLFKQSRNYHMQICNLIIKFMHFHSQERLLVREKVQKIAEDSSYNQLKLTLFDKAKKLKTKCFKHSQTLMVERAKPCQQFQPEQLLSKIQRINLDEQKQIGRSNMDISDIFLSLVPKLASQSKYIQFRNKTMKTSKNDESRKQRPFFDLKMKNKLPVVPDDSSEQGSQRHQKLSAGDKLVKIGLKKYKPVMQKDVGRLNSKLDRVKLKVLKLKEQLGKDKFQMIMDRELKRDQYKNLLTSRTESKGKEETAFDRMLQISPEIDNGINRRLAKIQKLNKNMRILSNRVGKKNRNILFQMMLDDAKRQKNKMLAIQNFHQ